MVEVTIAYSVLGLLLCLLVWVVIIYFRQVSRQSRLDAQKQLSVENRVPLSDEDFAKAFPPQQKEIALKVRLLVAKAVNFDAATIRPSDIFNEDLGLGSWRDSLADVEIVIEIEKAFDFHITDYEAQNVKTVSDLVNLIAEKPAKRAREIATMIPPRRDL